MATMAKKFQKTGVIYALAFLVPVAGLLAVYAAVGMVPFGDNSLLIGDVNSQYVSFFSYFRSEMLSGGADFGYTFSKALGGDMAGLSAYYLGSPLNLVLLLFPTALLPVGWMVLILLKVGLCGLGMSILLNARRRSFATLLFSVPYALMDYVIAYQQNLMWLDAVMLLPLVVLGIERILAGKSPLCYILALAAALWCNFYTGYMLCLFSVLWFVVSFFFFHPHPGGGLKTRVAWKPVGVFAGGSLLAGGLAAVLLLPALLSMQGGKVVLAASGADTTSSFAGLLSRYLPGTIRTENIFQSSPHLYAGVVGLVCLVLFFGARRIPLRRKLGALVLLAVLCASFCVGGLNLLWHGLAQPVGFWFRQSFLFSFVLLYFGWQGFTRMRGTGLWRRLLPALAVVAGVVLLAWRSYYPWVTNGKLLFALVLALAAGVLLWLHAKKRFRLAALGLLVVVLADMGAGVLMTFRQYNNPYSHYASYIAQRQPAVEWVKEQDDGFFRMESLAPYSNNDPMLFGYHGLSHYSSTDKLATRAFLDALGFSDGGYSVWYGDGSTVAAESLLGLRYLISPQPLAKPYALQWEGNGVGVYQNPLALPIGFIAGPQVGEELPAAEGGNLFDSHNRLWRALAPGVNQDLYRPAIPEGTTLHNLNFREDDGIQLYERIDTEAPAYLEFTLRIDSDDELYLLARGDYRRVSLLADNLQLAEYMTNDRHGIVALGSHTPGSTYTLRFELGVEEMRITDIWFAYEDGDVLDACIAQLSAQPYRLDSFSESAFDGQVENTGAADAPLLLIIPYDTGWQAWLDGASVEITPALGTLCSVQVPPGQHRLQLRYTPPGLWAGAIVSLGSLAALVVWLLWRRRVRRAKAAIPSAPGPAAGSAEPQEHAGATSQ